MPLTEPLRATANSYPSAYPANLYGETPHAAMANQLTALAMEAASHDYVTVHTVVGESGQPMTVIKKNPTNLPADGTSGRAYDATLFEASAITRLTGAMGKTYGIGAIVVTHGESDAGNNSYDGELFQLLTDYNDGPGRHHGPGGDREDPDAGLAAELGAGRLGVGVDLGDAGVEGQRRSPGRDRLHGPEVPVLVRDRQRARSPPAQEYERLGEKTAQVYFERVVLGHDWQPLQPMSAERERQHRHRALSRAGAAAGLGRRPAGAARPMIPQWAQGAASRCSVAGNRQMITGVEIVGGDTVKITCANDLTAGEVVVGYAATAEGGTPPTAQPARWGHLRDSDPFVGTVTGNRAAELLRRLPATIP